MSNRQRKNVKRSAYSRGPSRPVDPRRAPGYYRRRGPDPFALSLILISGIVVVVIVAIIAINTSNNSSAGSPAAPQIPAASISVSPNWTQTTVAFDTVTAPSLIPRITIQDAKALFDTGNVKIIDVRLKQYYDAGHIKGATNIPENTIGTKLNDVPKTGNLILYCDCPHDEESAGTAYSLKTAGYSNMKVLQGPQAFTLWKNAGYPTETGTP
jgi:rhodanese-related sulfurtransferase